MNLYLLRYNNYYNRIVKREEALSGYTPYLLGPIIQGVNFFPNDFINTQQVVNWEGADPDYVVVTDKEGNIDSRWFVISTYRIRKGQLRLELYRDLLADFYTQVVNAPCFIEKATIQRTDDPAIFNKENMGFNQIKRAQYSLQDESKTAWIVGYIPRDSFATGETLSTKYSYMGSQYDTFEHLSDYPYYQYNTSNPFLAFPENLKYGMNIYMNHQGDYGDNYYDITLSIDNVGSYRGITNLENKGYERYTGNRTYWTYGDLDDTPYLSDAKGKKIFAKFATDSSLLNTISGQAEGVFIQTQGRRATQALYAEQEKIIKNNEDGQFYRVVLTPVRKETITNDLVVGSALYNSLYDNIDKALLEGTPNNETFQVSGETTYYAVTFQLLATEVSVSIPAIENRYHLNDSPYDMFCIPFPREGQELSIEDANGDNYIDIVDRAAGFTIATSIASKLGQGNIYDLQLLPYCPIREALRNNAINIGELLKSDITVTKPDGVPERVNVMFWCMQSQFHFQIPFKINAANNVLDKKVKSETEMWRLCSPNYNGIFEFDLQKNNGISYVDVDCTYKPFNPYIHMNPNFGGLYGYDWDDSRGLICGGDFSLPITTSAWADYELQNKNYQQMFDRQIQNMEVNNSIQKTREIWGAATGTLGAGAGGAAAGSMMAAGGPVGIAAGAAVGTVTSAIGGIADIALNEQLRNEALDYTKDQFGYQLGNIKALPQGLAKISAFTANNKIFPFIEQYTCTPVEIEALKNKLKYNGMTIMRIGSIYEFLGSELSYIKGQLIRIDNLPEDYHILNAIASEIFKGVFI